MRRLKETLIIIKNEIRPNNFFLKAFFLDYFYSPQFRILLNHHLGKYLAKSRFFLFRHLAAYYKSRLVSKRNCDISYSSTIGENLSMPHPIGIVIGDKVVIKDNVTIFQQVTLGSHGKSGQRNKYPVLENGVKVYAGAKIIGGITIGANAIVGTNAVVNIDVPTNSVAVGIPCRIIKPKI
ncbi:hypothetical protein GH721_01330 [Kriegella sp. EG-1]|nr:hypothetical protein [Flavobacteriaceae bacterium EG-1]